MDKKKQEEGKPAAKTSGIAEKKKEVARLIYAGPTLPEFLLIFGKVYEKVPQIPDEYKELKLERFFVKISDYPKEKSKLAKDAEKVLKRYREILKAKRKENKGR